MGWEYSEITVAVVKVSRRGEIKITKIRSVLLLAHAEWWGAGVVICLKRGADLHMAKLMSLPLTVSCSSKIQIGFTFLVPAHPGSPGKRAVKRVCVRVCVCL